MPDDFLSEPSRVTVRRRSNGRYLVLALVGAVALGGAAALWTGSRLGWVEFGGDKPAVGSRIAPSALPSAAAVPAGVDPAQTALGVRLAELEQRMVKLNLAAEAASGNAARAESLLTASAARRTVERGMPLGYLEDQLKLRFANAQPNAVATLIEVSRNPVTLDMLEQGLAGLGPALVSAPRDGDVVMRVRDELSHLFVIRRASAPSPAPERRYERAKMYLETGRAESAIDEVKRMPGQTAAREWLALAQRYVRAQRALDLIETAAILEPRELKDGSGTPIGQAAPVVAPGSGADATF